MGIDQLDVSDVKFAQEIGYRIKLLAVAELDGDTLELHVSPTLVKRGRPLSDVSGPFNAIRVVGDAVGELMFYGRGAGQMPTASAVVADMIDTAVGRTASRSARWSCGRIAKPASRRASMPKPTAAFTCVSTPKIIPGVLAQVANVLGQHNISISSVLQQEAASDDGTVPLVIMTHVTTEGATRKACAEINQAVVRARENSSDVGEET